LDPWGSDDFIKGLAGSMTPRPPLLGRRGPEHGWYFSDLFDDAMLWFLDQGVRVAFALHAIVTAIWTREPRARRLGGTTAGEFVYVLCASWALALGSGSTFYGAEQAAYLGLGRPATSSALMVAGHAGGFVGALASGALCDRVSAKHTFRTALACLVPAALVRGAAAGVVRMNPMAFRGGVEVAVLQGAANALENFAYAAATVAGELWLVRKEGGGAGGPVAALLAGVVLATLSGTWVVDTLGWGYTAPAEVGAVLAVIVLLLPRIVHRGWEPGHESRPRATPATAPQSRTRAQAEMARRIRTREGSTSEEDAAAAIVAAPVSVAMFSLGWVFTTFWYPALLENAGLEEYVPRAATFLVLAVTVALGNATAALASGPVPLRSDSRPHEVPVATATFDKASDDNARADNIAAPSTPTMSASGEVDRDVAEADRMFVSDPQLRLLVVSAIGMAGCLGLLLAFSPETSDEPALYVAFFTVLGVALLYGASLASAAELRARAWMGQPNRGVKTGLCAAAGRAAATICVARAPTIGYYRVCAFGVAYTLVLLLPCLELCHRGGTRRAPPLAIAVLLAAVIIPAFSDDRYIPFLQHDEQ